MKKVYVPALDGLRGASIVLVLACHLLIYDRANVLLRTFGSACGSTGVSLFFVLSGYLITCLLLDEHEATGRIRLGRFYARRSLRIFPAYYVFLSAVAVLIAAGQVRGVPWYDVVASLMYVRNWVGRGHETAHLWSLAIEEQFYLVWPIVLLLTLRLRRPAAWVATLVVLVCAWRTFLVAGGRVSAGALYMRTDLRIDTILVGCLLAFVRRGCDRALQGRTRPALHGRPWVPVGILAAVLLWEGSSDRVPFAAAVKTTVTAVFLALLLHHVLDRPGKALSRPLETGWAVALGRLSYSLYLWQQLFLGPRNLNMPFVRAHPVLGLCVTFVAGCASYVLVERWFLAMKDRWFQPGSSIRVGAPGPFVPPRTVPV